MDGNSWGRVPERRAAGSHHHHVTILEMNGDSYRLAKAAPERPAETPQKNRNAAAWPVSTPPLTGWRLRVFVDERQREGPMRTLNFVPYAFAALTFLRTRAIC